MNNKIETWPLSNSLWVLIVFVLYGHCPDGIKSCIIIGTYSNIKRQKVIFIMGYVTINTRCQYCIILGPKRLHFLLKADSIKKYLFYLNYSSGAQ